MSRFLYPGLALLLASVVLVACAIGLAACSPQPPKPEHSVAWQASVAGFSPDDQRAITTALGATVATLPSDVAPLYEIDITSSKRDGDWALFFFTNRAGPTADPLPREPEMFLAHKKGTTWLILFPGTATFCPQVGQVPDSLLDSTEKAEHC